MPQSKAKHAVVRTGVVDARRANEPPAVPARGTAQVIAATRAEASVPREGAAPPPAGETTAVRGEIAASRSEIAASRSEIAASRCEAALLRVLRQAGMLPQDATRASADPQPSESAERLRVALSELEPEMALKLQTLLISGRDGQSVGAPQGGPSPASEAEGFASLAADSEKDGQRLIDYLRRGHSIACAMDIDVDSALADWRSTPSPDLDERAWLSFGKQLASSKPEDWQGFGVPGPRAQGFGKLYLKLGENAWWSFQTMLDRPTLAGVAKERRALAKRRVKNASLQTLDALVGQLGHTQGRALRRASRAIRARLGSLGSVLAPLRK